MYALMVRRLQSLKLSAAEEVVAHAAFPKPAAGLCSRCVLWQRLRHRHVASDLVLCREAMSNDTLSDFKVHKIQELKRQERREEARELLETVSKQVQPILRKRQWTVPVLKEFLPKNPNLLVRLEKNFDFELFYRVACQ